MQARKSTVVVVDSHAIMRDGLCALINHESDMTVVGTATNAQDTLHAVATLRPSVLVMDLVMPMSDGADTIAQIKKGYPEQRILVLTFQMDDQTIEAALRAGADSYMLKDDSRLEMLAAIRAVLLGRSFLSSAICKRVINGFLGASVSRYPRPVRTRSTEGSEALTQRECEVIRLIAEGYRTREIAAVLTLSEKTVEKHRSNLMRKLKLRSAAAVTAYAIANGFMQP